MGFDNVTDMKQQLSFAQSEYAWKKKVTRRERFLVEIEKVALGAAVRGDRTTLSDGQARAAADWH